MFRKIGQRIVAYEGEGTGGGAGGGTGDGTGGAAHPVTAPWATVTEGPWKIGEGDAAKPWWEVVPEPEARAHVEAKGYKTPAELALANYNLTKLQRGDPTVIGMPAADAPPEAWNEFYTKLGRPTTADAYDIKFPDGFKADDGMLAWAKPTFHEAGLTPKQAQILSDKWNEYVATTNQQATEADAARNQQEIDALAAKWGGDLDKNKAAGRRAVQALGLSPELIGKLDANIGAAAVVEMLAAIGRKADEGGFTGGGNTDPNDPDTMNKDQAQARIAQLQSDPAFMAKYTDKNNPGHADAVKQMERLFARA